MSSERATPSQMTRRIIVLAAAIFAIVIVTEVVVTQIRKRIL